MLFLKSLAFLGCIGSFGVRGIPADGKAGISPHYVPEFGQEFRTVEYSHLNLSVSFLNHGSYGETPKQVIDHERAFMEEYLSDNERINRGMRWVYWNDSVEAVASFYGSSTDRVAVTSGTTDGMNMVLQSLNFSSGDAILQNNYTYGGMMKTIADVAERIPGVEVITLNHAYPILSTQQIVDEYTSILDANPNIKLAVIDHICSVPSILFPIEELITLCKSRGVMTLIDGAHAVGQIPLNLNTLGADFYAGSLHKWAFGATGSGILYVDPKYTGVIKPNLVTFDHSSPFPVCAFYQGVQNYAPKYTAAKAVEFYNSIGGIAAVSAYNTDLGDRMADMLAAAWNTNKLDVPVEMVPPFIKTVFLPPMPNYPLDGDGTAMLRNDVRYMFDIWASFTRFQGRFTLRLSTQVYCVENDYYRLRDAILALQ